MEGKGEGKPSPLNNRKKNTKRICELRKKNDTTS